MSLARFYASSIPDTGVLELDESESHHAARVLRVQRGDDVLVFDGMGFEAFANVMEIQRKTVVLQIRGKRFAPRDHDGAIAFAVAMPKGDRQRNVIERLVELGVDVLLPMETERSVARLDADAIAKLDRYVVEACKQSMRNRFMEVQPKRRWGELLRDEDWKRTTRILVHPGEQGWSPTSFLEERARQKSSSTDPSANKLLFAIGPEGGFTDHEAEEAIAAGFERLSLGERILRVETAVSAAAVLADLYCAK